MQVRIIGEREKKQLKKYLVAILVEYCYKKLKNTVLMMRLDFQLIGK